MIGGDHSSCFRKMMFTITSVTITKCKQWSEKTPYKKRNDDFHIFENTESLMLDREKVPFFKQFNKATEAGVYEKITSRNILNFFESHRHLKNFGSSCTDIFFISLLFFSKQNRKNHGFSCILFLEECLIEDLWILMNTD